MTIKFRNYQIYWTLVMLATINMFRTFIIRPLYQPESDTEEALSQKIFTVLYDEEKNDSTILQIVSLAGNYEYRPMIYVGSSWPSQPMNLSMKPSICLATHATVDHLFWLAYHASSWGGLISVAIYVPGSDVFVAKAMIRYLSACHRDLKRRTAFHFVSPGFLIDRKLKRTFVNKSKFNCSKFEAEELNRIYLKGFNKRDTDSLQNYPQNVMRNIARNHCPTSHTITVDIDMISSKSLAVHLQAFLDSQKLCLKCAYVIPVYEVSKNVSFPPEDKASLMELLELKFARRYHEESYIQRCSQLEIWESIPLTHSAKVSILFETRQYDEGWEPIVVLHRTAPGFDERFVGYGRTRTSQIFLLHHLQFLFYVLENAILFHRGLQTARHYPNYRLDQIEVNDVKFQTFRTDVYQKYGPPKPIRGT